MNMRADAFSILYYKGRLEQILLMRDPTMLGQKTVILTIYLFPVLKASLKEKERGHYHW